MWIASSHRAPGDDAWMVRVSLSRSTSPFVGGVERYTAVDLDPGDPTPGVYPLLFEYGRMERTHPTRPWSVQLRRIEARSDDEARAISAAMYDAARGFLALGLVPTKVRGAVEAPNLLTVEIGDDAWTFPTVSAPEEAWAVLRAANAASLELAS